MFISFEIKIKLYYYLCDENVGSITIYAVWSMMNIILAKKKKGKRGKIFDTVIIF